MIMRYSILLLRNRSRDSAAVVELKSDLAEVAYGSPDARLDRPRSLCRGLCIDIYVYRYQFCFSITYEAGAVHPNF